MTEPWIVVQYDNRPLDEDNAKLIEQNRQYCKKHGYDHIFETRQYDLPPWWVKIKLVKEILNTNRYKGVLWLDTDAVVYDKNKSLDSLLLKDKSMYYSSDCPLWSSEFNAGVWMIKNDSYGNAIINTWMKSYFPNEWTRKGDKWTSSGEWAGSSYEQGAFIKYVKPHFQKSIYVYPWQVFQSYKAETGTFTLHFAGILSDTYLPAYLRPRVRFYIYLILAIFLCLLIAYFVYPHSSNRIFNIGLQKVALPRGQLKT